MSLTLPLALSVLSPVSTALPSRIAVVDLETTGVDPNRDRITEIAVMLLDDGVLVDTWQQLVNPGMSIPPEIVGLTGITNAMVSSAPRFGRVAAQLQTLLAGRVFVAHNARFDYGFIKQSFARESLAFTADVLCTVRLSRRLEPEYPSHSLDSLVMRHRLNVSDRHRALGDTKLVVELMDKLLRKHGGDDVSAAIKRILKMPSLPPNLPIDAIDNIPDCPGVYIFKGINSLPLYIGKSIDLRERVRSHFSSDYRNANDVRLSAEITGIEVLPCAGELGALLLEAKLVKTKFPMLNKALRKKTELALLDAQGNVLQMADFAPEQLPGHFGPFANKRGAKLALQKIASEHKLCWTALGLEKREGACFGYQVNKCGGLCVGKEQPVLHAARLVVALLPWRIADWPFTAVGGFAYVKEDSPLTGVQIHCFKDWCHLGTASDAAGLYDLTEARSDATFDTDVYKLLVKAHKKGLLRTLEAVI